jgi:hypothetical protein
MTTETIQTSSTNVVINYIPGCFSGTIHAQAYDGEISVFIHTTTGHYFNWSVAILIPDTAPEVIEGPKYCKGSKLQDAIDALAEPLQCPEVVQAIEEYLHKQRG